MNLITEEERNQDHLEALSNALERNAIDEVHDMLAGLHPAEVALLVESLPAKERDVIWEQIDPEQYPDVLAHAEDTVLSLIHI